MLMIIIIFIIPSQAYVMFMEAGEPQAPRRPYGPKPPGEGPGERDRMGDARDARPQHGAPPPRELPPRPAVLASKPEDDFFAEMAREAREEDERERQAAQEAGMG